MAYTVPPLPYDYDALEPHRRADDADPPRQAPPGLRGQGQRGPRGHRVGRQPDREGPHQPRPYPGRQAAAVRNNGGGHYNHTLFWESMSPDGGGEPRRKSRRDDRRGLRFLRRLPGEALKDAGVNQFGSGWAWLVLDGGSLAVVSTPNQDNPISDGKTPLLRRRRLGARLLPQVPEPPPRLHRRLVEHGRLGKVAERFSEAFKRERMPRSRSSVAMKAQQGWKRIPARQRRAIIQAAQRSAKKHGPRSRGRSRSRARPRRRSSPRSCARPRNVRSPRRVRTPSGALRMIDVGGARSRQRESMLFFRLSSPSSGWSSRDRPARRC